MVDDLDRQKALEYLQVIRAQSGDRDAHCELFGKYQRKLLYYLRRLLNESADAEDVLQEVWLRVFKRLGDLKDPKSFRPWLYRIARNQAISRIRKKKTTNLESVGEIELAGDESPTEDGIADQYSATSVHLALERLGANHREVLTLRFLEKLSYHEIAEIVGCSVGTVRSRIHYAKKVLKEILIEEAGSNG